MSVAVLVPFDGGTDEDRRLNWEWCERRWRGLHPDWRIVVAGGRAGSWCKPQAVNGAAQATDADVLVIADADVLADDGALIAAVRSVESGRLRWAVPCAHVYRLDRERTLELRGTDPLRARPTSVQTNHLDRAPYHRKAGGGIVVVDRAAFEEVHGMDPRFVGYGGEDKAFGYALRRLFGNAPRHRHGLWHLWHTPQQPSLEPSPANRELLERYRRAMRNEGTMRALVAEHT